MINFELSIPVYTGNQIAEICNNIVESANARNLSQEDTIYMLDNFVAVASYHSSILTQDCKFGNAGDVVDFAVGANNGVSLIGTKGVAWLLEQYDIESSVVPLSKIEIPSKVYSESCMCQWDSICDSAAAIETQSERCAVMSSIHAPAAIVLLEERKLFWLVQLLEYNPKEEKDADGNIRFSLDDIGYSLSHDWRKDKLADFAAEENIVKKMTEEMMSEGVFLN